MASISIKAPPIKIAAAFVILYLVWGSTYLAIRIGVLTFPPALFAGVRFILAALLLTAYARFQGQTLPHTAREWKIITVIALLLIVGGNGLVVWGEQHVPSNIAALTVASVALWIAGLGTLGPQGERLTRQSKLGLTVGFVGVLILLAPQGGTFSAVKTQAQLIIALAAISWASGTIYGRRQKPRTPPLMSAALQMLIGGIILCVFGLANGEYTRLVLTSSSLLALAYLVIFGSCLAYAAYVWLMHTVTPAKLGTYAYINPGIAVALGWWWLHEKLSRPQLIGMIIILAGVVLVTTAKSVKRSPDGPRSPD